MGRSGSLRECNVYMFFFGFLDPSCRCDTLVSILIETSISWLFNLPKTASLFLGGFPKSGHWFSKSVPRSLSLDSQITSPKQEHIIFWAVLIVMNEWAVWMTIFPILNGPSKRGEQQGGNGSHQPVKFTESIYIKYRRLLRGSEYLVSG